MIFLEITWIVFLHQSSYFLEIMNNNVVRYTTLSSNLIIVRRIHTNTIMAYSNSKGMNSDSEHMTETTHETPETRINVGRLIHAFCYLFTDIFVLRYKIFLC
jgi:hypothetical protein